jgi:hypothetical protein
MYLCLPLFLDILRILAEMGLVCGLIVPYLKNLIPLNMVVLKSIFILAFCSTAFIQGADILVVISFITIAFPFGDRLLIKVPSICNKLGECT